MEEQVINILLDIKADIGSLKKGQEHLKEGQQMLADRMDRFEGTFSELNERVGRIEDDMSEVKTTVNALAEGLLETSREVKQIKGKPAHL